MRVDDLIIGLAYFSIPASIAASLAKFSRLNFISLLPRTFLLWGVLFSLFVMLCGIGHILRAFDFHETTTYMILNILTAMVGFMAAVYLIPTGPAIVTNAEKSYQDLVNLNEETAASKRKLFTFMNFLCHEIRNPLFAITSNIEFAQDLPMTSDLYESLTGINQSAHLMLRLVNDVLDLSKIESGKLQLEPQQFNLVEFFNNMASTMERQVEAKHRGQVKFLFQMDPQIPKMVQSDSTRLLQICYNVLSNANKFTEQGSISFSILLYDPNSKTGPDQSEYGNKAHSSRDQSEASLLNGDGSQVNGLASLENFSFSALSGKARKPKQIAAASASVNSMTGLRNKLIRALPSNRSVGSHSDLSMDGSHSNPDLEKGKDDSDDDSVSGPDENPDKVTLYLVFEDTGIGIEEEHLSRIFQPYTQSKLSDFRKHGGTGLGLSIINKLLEMMHGTVSVSSRLNHGTRFVIKLPVKVVVSPKEQGGGSLGAVSIDIDNPRPSCEEQQAMSFAKLDETMMSMEMNEVDVSGALDQVSPFDSEIAPNPASPEIFDGTRSEENHAPGTPEATRDTLPGGGAADVAGAPLITDRDETSTPVTGNKVLCMVKSESASAGNEQPNQSTGLQPNSSQDVGFRPIPNVDDAPAPPFKSEGTTPKSLFALTSSAAGSNAQRGQTTAPLFALGQNLTATSAVHEAAPPMKSQNLPLFGLQQKLPSSNTSVQQSDGSNALFSLSGAPPQGAIPISAPAPISVVPGQPRVQQLAKFNFPKNKNMVLVVDDNGVNRKLLGKMLNYFNLDYLDAENGKMAVEIMERSQNYTGDESAPDFGLVLMDLCMPVMDGYEAIRQLRTKLNLKDVPIVALTASAMEDEKVKALRAGATEFATKPLLRPALHKKCLEYLHDG